MIGLDFGPSCNYFSIFSIGMSQSLSNKLWKRYLHKLSSSFSSITNNLVGIDSSVGELITSYLGLENNVCMIGICGMGGLGKTTLARVVYDKFCSHF